MFIELCKYGKEHPTEIKLVNGVRFCCTKEFVIGTGNDGTRVYLGLGKDGCEKAVKRLLRDTVVEEAEQERKILNESSAKKSNHVANYWFLDDESERDYLYLILDLCEENLENFIARTNPDHLLEKGPEIIKHVLIGLSDLHSNSQPILHRQLNPRNILRDVNDNWLLADFGLSRLLSRGVNTHRSIQRGTSDWRAVESYPLHSDIMGEEDVRYKKESDIQVRI